MPYTVWKNGKQIGATQFELSPGGRKRVGMFHPNEYGLTVLPGITAMFPALLEFEEMCRRNHPRSEQPDTNYSPKRRRDAR